MNVDAVFVWPGLRQYRVKGYFRIYMFVKASVNGILACIAGKRADYGDASNDGGFKLHVQTSTLQLSRFLFEPANAICQSLFAVCYRAACRSQEQANILRALRDSSWKEARCDMDSESGT